MRRAAALTVLLLLAAGLRFTALSWGLRHTPHFDERVFVENVWGMLDRGNLDHVYYEYPGLFFDLLVPVLAPLHAMGPLGPGAYLAARATVAAFGTLNVLLLYLLGRRLAGPTVGFVAALSLAVSPLDVYVCHMVRPDVLLATAALACYAACALGGPGRRSDLVAGACLGAATAVKFTGVLLAPSFVAFRFARRQPGLGRLALAAIAALAVFFLFTPAAVWRAQAFFSGIGDQVSYHYIPRGKPHTYLGNLLYYGRAAAGHAGPLGVGLFAVGLLPAVRRWRTWAPLLLHPLAVVAVMSTADYHFDRHLVPALGALCLVQALGVEALSAKAPRTALVAAAAAASFPLVSTVSDLRAISRPNVRDRVAEWVSVNLATGSAVLSADAGIGLDRARFELLSGVGGPRGALLVPHASAVIAPPGESARLFGLAPAVRFDARAPVEGEALEVALVPPAARAQCRELALDASRLSASESLEGIGALADGRLGTAWATAAPGGRGAWIEVRLNPPERLGRVELALGNRPDRQGRALRLEVTDDGVTWRGVRSEQARARVEDQLGGPRQKSQLLVLEPVMARGLRIIQTEANPARWSVAELRLGACETTIH
jgi:4-amino-4-deoxy-L-arabinose transferase-like glycosyltransferase